MAVAVASSTSAVASFGGSSGGTLSVNPPSGLAAGNLWVICGNLDIDPGAAISLPSGWTAIGSQITGEEGWPALRVFGKIAGASETAVSISCTGTVYDFFCESIRITGQHATTWLGNVATATSTGTGNTLDAPDVTIQDAGNLALLFFASEGDSPGSQTIAPPSGTTTIVEREGAVFPNASSAYEARNAGSYTPGNWTVTRSESDNLDGVALTVEIRVAASGGTTVSLSGQSATSAAGSLGPQTSKGLSGQSLTSAQGTASPANSVALTGSALTSAQGTAAPSLSKALSGGVLASVSGTVTPDLQIALTGQSLAFAQGDLTASTGADVTVSLSGQVISVSSGALAPAASVPLAGQVGTFAQGDVTPVSGVTIQLTGQALSLAQGALTSDISALLTGQNAALSQGVLGVPVTATETFSGGFIYAYQREMERRARRRREQEELEEESRELQDEVDREIALLLRAKEAEAERQAEIDRLRRLVSRHSNERLDLSDRAKVAYVRALRQANFSALEALDRELRRQIEEEDIAVLMLLLNE